MECAHNQEGFCDLFSPYYRTCNVPEDEEEWCNYFEPWQSPKDDKR